MKVNVLVFPCGSEIGLEVYRSLATAKEVVLFGASSVKDHGEFVYRNYISSVPFVSDRLFLVAINKIVKEYAIDYIIPAHDTVVLRLAEASRTGNLNCKLLTSSYEACATCCSKKLTHQLLSPHLHMPRLYESISDVIDWPVFLKPDYGSGSRGAVIARNFAEADCHIKGGKNLLIFEYLPGDEYTVDCFTDRHGAIIFCGGRKRERISNGISVRTLPDNDPKFLEIALKINKTLKLRGVWYFQAKRDINGCLALMEVAPRIAGAMGLYRNLGVNFALMGLYDAEGFDVKIIQNHFQILLDRALESRFKVDLQYEHVYLDYDDCIIFNNQINIQIVSFLYQCVNHGVGVSLLTRHIGDIEAELTKNKLRQLFVDVIRIVDGAPKSFFIRHKKSIFIDDSFAERKNVLEETGIPVFSPDAVESLLTIM